LGPGQAPAAKNGQKPATAQPCAHTTSEAFQAVSHKKFGMLQARENEISLRK